MPTLRGRVVRAGPQSRHPRELPDQRKGQSRMGSHYVLETVGGEHNQRDPLQGHRRRRVRRISEQRNLPEKIAPHEDPQYALVLRAPPPNVRLSLLVTSRPRRPIQEH